MTSSQRLHKNDKLWGAIAEALVAAYALIGANGKLTSYRPFTDVDGKDIVIDLAGGFKDIYIQVKCALGLNRDRWVVPAAMFYRRAYRTSLPKGMIQFNFDCRVAGDERWDDFEVTRAELGPRLVQLIRAANDCRRRAPMGAADKMAGRWLQIAA